MPWILILGGFLDVISATVQNYVRGVPLAQGYWESLGFRWPWLDPSATSGVPMFSYIFSVLFGYEGTVTLGVIVGSVFSILLVVSLWILYYKEA